MLGGLYKSLCIIQINNLPLQLFSVILFGYFSVCFPYSLILKFPSIQPSGFYQVLHAQEITPSKWSYLHTSRTIILIYHVLYFNFKIIASLFSPGAPFYFFPLIIKGTVTGNSPFRKKEREKKRFSFFFKKKMQLEKSPTERIPTV